MWNIGVVGVKTDASGSGGRGYMQRYRNKVMERLQRFDEAERRYKWHSGKWTREAMKVLVEQWTVGMMVVVPCIEALDDASPMIVTKE